MIKPDLVEYMAESIKIEYKEDDWGDTVLHVSDMGASPLIENQSDRKCPRQVWLRYHEAEKNPVYAGKLLMYDHGHTVEEKAVRYLRKSFARQEARGEKDYHILGTQVRVTSGFKQFTLLVGNADIVISESGKRNPEVLVVDVKSRDAKAFNKKKRLRPTEYFQVAGYIYALRNLNYNATTGCILEMDKSKDNFARPIYFEYNEHTESQVRATIEYLANMVEYKKPGRLEFISRNTGLYEPWQCQWCDFKGASCEGAKYPKAL